MNCKTALLYVSLKNKKQPQPFAFKQKSVVALGLSSSASLAEESGVFVGVGAGANTWAAKDNEDFKAKTGFSAALNAGLRTQFGKHHGIEVVARVPFIDTTLENNRTTGEKQTGSHTYNVSVRYILSF